MNSTKRYLKGSLGLIALAIIIFLLFTPYGVHTFGETLFGGDDTKQYPAENHPVPVDLTKSVAQTIILPESVKQPSGIDYSPKNQTYYVVTDQAEIIELSRDLKQVKSVKTMSNKPLLFRQGSVESADYYENKLYVGGDRGGIKIWEKTANGWVKSETIKSQSHPSIALEAEALAINPANGDIYLGKDHMITVINQQADLISEFSLNLIAKSGRYIEEYSIAGMDFDSDKLYVITEYHSAILTINPQTETVDSIFALNGITEGSGLTVSEDAFIVVVDHELTEASPGVKIYDR